MPCFAADHGAIERLQRLVEAASETAIQVVVKSGLITAGALRIVATPPQALSDAFVSGQWNPTAMLLADSTK